MKKSLLIISAITMLFSGKVFSQEIEFMTVFDPIAAPYTLPATAFNSLYLGYPSVVEQDLIDATWTNVEKISSPKNAQGNFTEMKIYSWNSTSSLWEISETNLTFTYTYDGSNKMTSFIRTYNDVSTGDIMQRNATSITYNGSQISQIVFIDSLYDVANSLWMAISGTEDFEYAGTLLSSRTTAYTAYNGIPIDMPVSKINYSYSGNNVTEELTQSYDSQNSTWINDSRRSFTYSGNNITAIMGESYDDQTSTWSFDTSVDYTYDGSNRVATVVYDSQDTHTYTYGANNKIDVAYIDEVDTNGVLVKSKVEVTYDINNSPEIAYSYAWNGTAYETVSVERTLWSDPNPNPLAPNAPTNLAVDPVKANQILRLTWTDNADNETGFKIERSTDGTNYTLLSDIPTANTVTYDDTNLPDATTYYYRVLAYNADGSSSFSNVANGTTYSASLTSIVSENGSVYPNPFNKTLNINWTLDGNYKILSLNGTEIQIGKIVKGINTLDLSKTQAGSYILQIESEGNITNSMLIKE